MRKHYWIVYWGKTANGKFSNGRIAQEETSEEAKKYCYGLATDDMVAVDLGTRRSDIQKNIRKIDSKYRD